MKLLIIMASQIKYLYAPLWHKELEKIRVALLKYEER